MKKFASCRTDWLSTGLAVLALTGLTGLFGCNTSPSGNDISSEYRAEGAYVQAVDSDTAHAVARLYRNDTTLTAGSVRIANSALGFFADYFNVDSAFQAVVHPAATLAGDDVYLVVSDGIQVTDSFPYSIVDTFSITDQIDPANHQLQGAGQVSLTWTSAANAEGYVVAAVKADEAFTGTGYCALAATVGTSGTIPPDAFLDPVSQEADTGLYNIYVYAYQGDPDSALASKFLPTPWPLADTDNIDKADISGRFGTIAVAAMDTIRVVIQSF